MRKGGGFPTWILTQGRERGGEGGGGNGKQLSCPSLPLDVTWRSRPGIFIPFSGRLSLIKWRSKNYKERCVRKQRKTFRAESWRRREFVSLRRRYNKDTPLCTCDDCHMWNKKRLIMDAKWNYGLDRQWPCLGAILGRKATRRPQRRTCLESIVWSGDLCRRRAPCFLRILAPAEGSYEW